MACKGEGRPAVGKFKPEWWLVKRGSSQGKALSSRSEEGLSSDGFTLGGFSRFRMSSRGLALRDRLVSSCLFVLTSSSGSLSPS